jgi:hypothetical protein
MRDLKSLLRNVAVAATLICLPLSAFAMAPTCDITVNDCDAAANVTSSHIQIGGPGSLSSNETCGANPSCDDPGRLDGGTIAEAMLSFQLDRSTGRLTIELHNSTDTTASLTAIYFNPPAAVTGVTLDSASLAKACPQGGASCPLLSTWTALLDPANIGAAGFGRFDVYVGNGGGTGNGGGNPVEIGAGDALSLDLMLTGDLSGLTACSFTSEGSKIPPGSKVVTGIGRFQAGEMNGDSGWIAPCRGGDLFVELRFFKAEARDGDVLLTWDTATELDNLGFNVLRKPELGGPWQIINPALVPAQGDPLAGASYSLVDTDVVNGVEYRYRLEDIDLHGFNTLHPPKRAVANPASPPIKLKAPAYGRSFQAEESMALAWATDLRGPARVQLSADPTFPEDNRVEFPARARGRLGEVEVVLNRHEAMMVSAVAATAEDGQVYWRVVSSRSANQPDAVSDVFRFQQER